MRKYIFRRILFFVPAILALSLISFLLLHYAPGDPVEQILGNRLLSDDVMSQSESTEKLKSELRHQLGLDLPVFYFSIDKYDDHSWKSLLPAISIHRSNQFHQWLFGSETKEGVIHGDFGSSYLTHQPVMEILKSRIGWSLFFTLSSVFLAYLISIPLALKMAAKPAARFIKPTTLLLDIFYSLPSFWVATLLMFLFCNPDLFNILPSSGTMPIGGFEKGAGFLERLSGTIPYLILPTITYTYSSFAFLTGSLRSSIEDILQQDYIRTAYAKGLDEKKILYKHAFRNALLPVITIFSQVFPFAIGGSVILESIFTIPGMGLTIFQSISSQDYPVIITVFMLTGLITMSGFLLSDILYSFADPRISISKNTRR